MALPLLTSSDVGAVARAKINAAIAEASKVQSFIDADLNARNGVDGGLYPYGRPGDGFRYFTTDTAVKDARAYAPLNPAQVVVTPFGLAYEMTAAGSVLSRKFYDVEQSLIYRPKASFYRASPIEDPNGDAFSFFLRCYAGDTLLGSVLLETWQSNDIPSGIAIERRYYVAAYLSTAEVEPTGVIRLPQGTTRVRLEARAYGGPQQTRLLVLDMPEAPEGLVGTVNDAVAAAAQAISGANRAESAAAAVPGLLGSKADINDARIIQSSADTKFWAGLRTLLASGTALIAYLGDSTGAGIGNGSGSNYGECRFYGRKGAWSLAYYSSLLGHPGFVPLSPKSWPVSPAWQPEGSSLNGPLPTWRFVVSEAPFASQIISQRAGTITDKLSVLYEARTNATAPRFRVVVSTLAGVELVNQEFDSYTPAVAFGSISEPVQSSVEFATVTLPTPTRTVVVSIQNLSVVTRPEGSPVDGTLAIGGYFWGDVSKHKNLAVSSTTLLNNSAANQSRGITTDDRLAAAYAFGANVFVLGWGTNDSKTGVSTVANFTADYLNRINQIRANSPRALILLETAPRGAAGSEWANNPAYNVAIREVAKTAGVALLDREVLIDAMGPTAYFDGVHPSELGYGSLEQYISARLGITSYALRPADADASQGVAVAGEIALNGGGTDSSGNFVAILQTPTLARPVGAKTLTVEGHVFAAKTTAIDQMAFDLELTGGGATKTMHAAVVSAALVGSVALAEAVLKGVHVFTQASTTSVVLRLRGKNYQLRAGADGITKLSWRWD